MRNCGEVAKTQSYAIISRILSNENNVLTDIEIDGIDWQDASAEIVEMLCDKKARLKGKINIVGNNQITFELKKKLIAQYGNIDDESNGLYIDYEKRAIRNVTMIPKQYFAEVGEYQLTFELDSPYANNYTHIEWSLAPNLYATINSQTGVLTISRMGEEVDGTGPNADATVTIYLLDGTSVSASSNLNFWIRDAKLGDVVYHDGTFSSANDYESNVQAGKTPIGICFYIAPNDKTKRLMVSLKNVGSDKWGPASNQLSGITLADNPSVSVYNIAKIINNSPSVTYNGLRDELSGDADGWAIFDGYSDVRGQIGWRTFTTNEFGYKIGDSIPWGQYNQLAILDVRNLCLSDSNIQLPIPQAVSEITEFQIVNMYKTEAITNKGSGYDALYYPIFSLAYAYRPATRTDLLEKFAEHHWWVPSPGELMRIAYLYQEYYNPNNSEGVENPLNVFKDALDNNILTVFSGNNLSSHESSSNVSTSTMYLNLYYNNTYHSYRSGQTSKQASNPFRAICAF